MRGGWNTVRLQRTHSLHQLFDRSHRRDASCPKKRHFNERAHAQHIAELILHFGKLVGNLEDASGIAEFCLRLQCFALVCGDLQRIARLLAESLPHHKITEMHHQFARKTTHVLAGGIECGD